MMICWLLAASVWLARAQRTSDVLLSDPAAREEFEDNAKKFLTEVRRGRMRP